MEYVAFLLIGILFLAGTIGGAVIFVIRYTLNAKMAVLQTDATKLAVFDMRLNEHINKPDSSMEQYRQIVERIEAAEISIRGIKRESESKDESMRRLIAKNAARQRFSKDEPDENNGLGRAAHAAGDPDQNSLEALAAQGKAIPWPNNQPHPNSQPPASFGKIAIG